MIAFWASISAFAQTGSTPKVTAEDTSISSVGDEDFYLYLRARTGAGLTDFIQFVPITKVATEPKLAMKNLGGGKFSLSMIPNKFFASVNPTNQKILSVQFQIVRGKIRNSNDTVDGTYEYFLNQNCE